MPYYAMPADKRSFCCVILPANHHLMLPATATIQLIAPCPHRPSPYHPVPPQTISFLSPLVQYGLFGGMLVMAYFGSHYAIDYLEAGAVASIGLLVLPPSLSLALTLVYSVMTLSGRSQTGQTGLAVNLKSA